MNKEEKGVAITELTDQFLKNPYFYITEASGMTVAEVNVLRRSCFERGIHYKVVKNTLIKKALEPIKGDFSPLNDVVLTGQSAVMYHPDDQKAPARFIKEFSKKNDKFKLKGASIDTSLFIGADQIETLLALKGKQELLGEIIGLLQSPAQNLVSAIQSPAQNLISALQSGGTILGGILKTLSEREEA